jgi:hypothetical protein
LQHTSDHTLLEDDGGQAVRFEQGDVRGLRHPRDRMSIQYPNML